MAIIQFVLTLFLLGTVYVRMVRRETPEPVSRAQAVLPVVFGIIAVPVSFLLLALVGGLLNLAGISFTGLPAVPRSVVGAFFLAGFTEETAKLLFILLTVFLFRRKIRNVYEYILIGAAVGFGFALLEEFFYGADGILALFRLFTVGAHMIFGMIMAGHLGAAAWKKAAGTGGAALDSVLAVVLPMTIHTLFNASNVTNRLLNSDDDVEQLIGMLIALAATVILFAAQFIIIRRFKKNAEKYCGMILNRSDQSPASKAANVAGS